MKTDKNIIDNQKCRDSNLELFRIISMLIIIAHHYIVNSGMLSLIDNRAVLQWNDVFLLLFGWGGKTGINCFLLITGFFMCKSNITIKKYIHLIVEIEFYYIIIYLCFVFSGYVMFDLKEMIKTMLPVKGLSDGFVSCYLIFFLLIPFINKLIAALTQKEHKELLFILLLIFSIMGSIPGFYVVVNYVEWFSILYLLGAYIRIYPIPIFQNCRLWGIITLFSLALSWLSVVILAFYGKDPYFLVSDSNKILALITGLSSFLFFKNIKIEFNWIINTIARSTFGVLLIHTNSRIMRQWLWKDLLKVTDYYDAGALVIIHGVICVLSIYVICTLLDLLRGILFKKISNLGDNCKKYENNHVSIWHSSRSN